MLRWSRSVSSYPESVSLRGKPRLTLSLPRIHRLRPRVDDVPRLELRKKVGERVARETEEYPDVRDKKLPVPEE